MNLDRWDKEEVDIFSSPVNKVAIDWIKQWTHGLSALLLCITSATRCRSIVVSCATEGLKEDNLMIDG